MAWFPRTIGESTLPLVEQWRLRTEHTIPSRASASIPPYLFISNGKAIMDVGAGWEDQQRGFDGSLTAFDIATGQIIWQTLLADPRYSSRIGNAYQGAERLYLAYSFRVQAFSLQTGEMLWQSPELFTRTSHWFCNWDTENPLKLYASKNLPYDNETISFDPPTGAILSRDPNSDYPICERNGQIEFVKTPQALLAVDQITGQTLWERVESQRPYDQMEEPVFLGEEMLFQVGYPRIEILRVEIQTGKTTWRTEREYVSSMAILGSWVLALRQDGVLVALDIETGEMVGALTFEGKPLEVGTGSYWVVANDPYVLLFFSDNQELIVLKKQ